MWQDLSCQPPLTISTAKSFGDMAKYFCTKSPTSRLRFVLKNNTTHALILKEFGGLLTSEIWDGQMSTYPHFLEWRVEKSQSNLFVLRTTVFSNFLLLYDDKLWLQAWLLSNRSKREDRDTPCDIVILGYCDMGIISQVWAALHAVGNRIIWLEGQSTFCDGKVGGSTSITLVLQSLVDFYSNVIYKGKRGNCHVQLFNSWVSWLAV